jgi:hypothetical protein
MLDIYTEAERTMLEKVARRVARGIDQPGWAERKLAETQQMRREIEREIQSLQKATGQVGDAVQAAYEVGAKEAERDLARTGALKSGETTATFGRASRAHIEALVRKTIDNLSATHLRILRATEDAYRGAIADAASQVLTGTQTRREAAQAALRRFADQGISGFRDAAGRNWDIASYAEMATRSATGQAAIEGHIDTLAANGNDLVIVSDSPEECEICRPWEGKVLSISGRTGYPSLADARAQGLFHPSCTHTVGVYIEGLTRPMKGTKNPEGYTERQQQRHNERQIRHWKRREAVAITDQEKATARAKVREWQARQRAFIDETGRIRRRERESITRAR